MANKRAHLNHREPGFRPQARPELAQMLAEMGRGSATQRHTLKKYKGSRTSNKKAAIKDYS
jgi:hypothetical protein